MEVHQQLIVHSYQDDLPVLQIVVGTPLQTSTCTVVDCVPIAYQVVMLVVFLVRIVDLGMDEELVKGFPEDFFGVVSDRNVILMDLMLVGMDLLRGIEQAISMHYRGVHPSCTIVDRKVDHLFRIEVVLVMHSAVETKALLAGRIVAETKMQKLAIFAPVRIIVD